MRRITIGIAAIMLAFPGSIYGGVSLGQQATSSCSTSGTVMLQGIPAAKEDLIPSLGRAIAGYGRQAKVSDCTIALTCVSMDSGEQSLELARQQCVVVRDRLVSSGFVKESIATTRKGPGGGLVAGAVYLTVQ